MENLHNFSASAVILKIADKYDILALNDVRRMLRDVMHKVTSTSTDDEMATIAQERHLRLVGANPDAPDDILERALTALCDAALTGHYRLRSAEIINNLQKRAPVELVAEAPEPGPTKRPNRKQRDRALIEELRGTIAEQSEKLMGLTIQLNRPKEDGEVIRKMTILKQRSAAVVDRFAMYESGNLGNAKFNYKGLQDSISALDGVLRDSVQSNLCTETPLPTATKALICTLEPHIHQRTITPAMLEGATVGESGDHCSLWLKIPGYRSVYLGATPQTMSFEQAAVWKARIAKAFNGDVNSSERLVFQEKRSIAHLCGIDRHKVFILRYEFTKATANAIIGRITRQDL